jgi:hypothetical protein
VNRLLAFGVGVTLAAGAVVVGYSIQRRSNTAQEFQRQVELAKMEAERIRQSVILPTVKRMPAGENFASALQ